MVLFHRWKTATWNMILAAELPGLWPQRQEGLEDRKMVCFCDPILSSEKRENSDRILTKDISLVGYDTNKIKILKCVFFLLSKVKKKHTFGHGVIEIYWICKCWNITYCNITSLNCLYMIGSGSKIAPPVLEVYLSLGLSDWKGSFSILSTCLMLGSNMKTSWNLQRQKKKSRFLWSGRSIQLTVHETTHWPTG